VVSRRRVWFRVWLAGLLVVAVIVTIASASPSPRVRPPGPVAATREGIRLVPLDGGAHYFANLSPRSAWMDKHILLGAWLEQPQSLRDVQRDAAMGDNIYWNLPGGSVNYDVIREGGMHVSAPSEDAQTGSETVSWEGDDEADMNLGPGWHSWDNKATSSCMPSGSQCGYTDADFYFSDNTKNVTGNTSLPYPIDGRAVIQGYGKGVLFWDPARQAAHFLSYSDILEADSYWLTDDDLQTASQGGCGLMPDNPTVCRGGGGTGLDYTQSHLPANYAYNVTRLRALQALNGHSKPIVAAVETGCPFASGESAGNCATPSETRAAAWHALIAGARGIVWFQHNFSGPCVDFRTLLDGSNNASGEYNCQQTPGVTLHDVVRGISGFNHEVAALNKVLLSPTMLNYVSTGADVSLMAKAYEGVCYVFAGSGSPATPPSPGQLASFKLAGAYTGPIRVYDEGRTVYARRGRFEDRFANANSVHIYEIHDPPLCAAP
jgi:hypothetical protein